MKVQKTERRDLRLSRILMQRESQQAQQRKKTAEKFTYSHQQVDRWKRENSLSDKTTLRLLSGMRRASGDRFLIEPYYKEHCTKRNRILKDFFEVSELQGSMGVVCRDTSLLIEMVMNARGLSSSDVLLQKICIDQGAHRFTIPVYCFFF